jgi:hypothetical protein
MDNRCIRARRRGDDVTSSSISKGISRPALYARVNLDPPNATACAIEVKAAASQPRDTREGGAAVMEERAAAFTGGDR